MKNITLHNEHIKLYKRKNSKFWQMRIKPPREKAIRESSGCKSLKEAKEIALKKYYTLTKNKKFIHLDKNFLHAYKGRHLLGIINLERYAILFRFISKTLSHTLKLI